MARTPGHDKNGRRKGKWAPEEDAKLSDFVTKYGCTNWRRLPRLAGLSRCGKSCRLRWLNYLRPNVKLGNYSKEEEEVILRLHGTLGNKWSAIATHLPGRTDNEVKNHWHTYLKKRLLREQSSSSASTTPDTAKSTSPSSEQAITTEPSVGPETHRDDISSTSPRSVTGSDSIHPHLPSSPHENTSTSEPISLSTVESGPTAEVPISWHELDVSSLETCLVSPGRFWTEPFIPDTSFPGYNCALSFYEDDYYNLMFGSPVHDSLW